MQYTAASVARLFRFAGGNVGPWHVARVDCVAGEPLLAAGRLSVTAGAVPVLPHGAAWVLRGITSNEHYVVWDEKVALLSKQESLGRPASTWAALIPIRKTAAWWALAQDERRKVFEAQSKHIASGLKYLPGVARRLHHCRDLGRMSPSTSSLGSSLRHRKPKDSTSWWKRCVARQSGIT